MKVLGLDTSGMVAGVALWEDDIIRAEYSVNYKKTHSQTLMPMLEEMCRMAELDMKELDGIAIASGPGSFTGLRIGSATAKGLGLALNKPLVEVPTLEGLAYSLWGSDRLVCPLMDARRSQVYTGFYEFASGEAGKRELKIVAVQRAMAAGDMMKELNELGREVIFLGDGVPVYEPMIRDELQVPFLIAPAHLNRQRAAGVAALGAEYLKKGKGIPAKAHVPEYLRLSQAERERAQEG